MRRISRSPDNVGGAALTMRHRGALIGLVSTNIRDAAGKIGISVDLRSARLQLATEVFGVRVNSYNELSDRELEDISKIGPDEIAIWMSNDVGFTLPLWEG